jgi:hypothetical protein
MRIKYISQGAYKTGGYRHEINLFQASVAYFSKNQEVESKVYRAEKSYNSFIQHLQLLIWAFFKSNADLNICTVRTALPAIVRNWFNKKQIWVVLHNYDEHDDKSKNLNSYYQFLFKILKNSKSDKIKVIAVAPYWVKYFSEVHQLKHVHYFPNLFETKLYSDFIKNKKYPWIHLGQFSTKNDPQIRTLAKSLSTDGYYCFFSTLDPQLAHAHNGAYDIIYFHDFNDYLEQISHCCFTLALSQINEGWNRVAHESILLGTPVIGYNKAGLGDLLKLSNSVIVNDIHEAYVCIKESLWVLPESNFNQLFDTSHGETYIQKICLI